MWFQGQYQRITSFTHRGRQLPNENCLSFVFGKIFYLLVGFFDALCLVSLWWDFGYYVFPLVGLKQNTVCHGSFSLKWLTILLITTFSSINFLPNLKIIITSSVCTRELRSIIILRSSQRIIFGFNQCFVSRSSLWPRDTQKVATFCGLHNVNTTNI